MATLACVLTLCAPNALPSTPYPVPPARGGLAVLVSRGGQALPETPVETGRRLAAQRGWVREQWACLYRLWSRESGWRVEAANRGGSGATGIPQALPGWKMASAGADWRTSAATQIRWGLGYISGRYGDPCSAYAQSNAQGYY